MHGGDAQFNCSTSKVVKFGQLPDHDILIDYGLIVNRLVVVDFFSGGGGEGSYTYKSCNKSYTPINSNAGRLQRTNCRKLTSELNSE